MAQQPVPQNVTVDIYRNADPTAPVPTGNAAVAQVPGNIKPVMTSGRFGKRPLPQMDAPADSSLRDRHPRRLQQPA